ncbi:serine hydrolase [Erythrobacter sp. QSSC1-22B]|uniref:serine hydrolase n=1 Tax=Erythrobacter sp. QSSC1-22B TaxID=1860125 RepID=UPI0008055959|nr:serine hydrolase [Erythrobacter sp. QSSC1-22B]OBX20215.1 serine hydrolase [Erythrobacter sp. QSSC1-22B]
MKCLAPALLSLGAVIAPLAPLAAQEATMDEPAETTLLEQRTAQVVGLVNVTLDPREVVSDSFLQAVPAEQLKAFGAQLTAQFGQALAVESIVPVSPTRAAITIRMERALASGGIAIQTEAPGKITELLLQSFAPIDDSADKITADLAALPGSAAAWFGPLDGEPAFAFGDPQRQLALGSTFKLYVLSALDRAVAEGRLDWDDVVTLGDRSFPSGVTQDWPDGAPLTLHTAATLMISISDNTATDLLIDAVGREAVEAEMRATGHSAPDRSTPFLKTVEMFVLKGGDQGAAYAEADEAGRRAILAQLDTTGADPAPILAVFAGGTPVMIDSIEWFASMEDERRLMRRLAETEDDTARQIMAVNTALESGARADWSYVGYKGGSEQGVRNLSWLLRDEAGAWHMLALCWNNPAAETDTATLLAIAQRILALDR